MAEPALDTRPPAGPSSELAPPDADVLKTLRRGRRRPGRWLIAGVVVVLLAGAATWAFWPTGTDDARWELSAVERGDLVVRVTAVGQLEAVDTVEVGSDLSGRISEVLVDVNDEVHAGQILARIDPEPYERVVAQAEAALAQARAGLAQSQVTLRSAELTLARTTRLEAEDAATGVELENAQLAVDAQRAAVDATRAQVAQARAALDKARDDLDDSVIASPIAGVVTQRLIDPGQTVVSALQATPLFEVASDLTEMKAEVGVDEADVGRVAAGQPATFTVSAWPDRTFTATVRAVDIAPDPMQTVVVYDAELRLVNPDLALRPGMTATAEIEVGRIDDVLLVPSEALRYAPREFRHGRSVPESTEGDAVWQIVDERPVATLVDVLGSDGRRTAISGDIDVDAKVVLSEVGR